MKYDHTIYHFKRQPPAAGTISSFPQSSCSIKPSNQTQSTLITSRYSTGIMRVFVVPASGKTATAAIRSLLDQTSSQDPPIEIKAVYRNTAKAPPEFASKSNIEVLKGDITDASSLDFTGANAVITLTPPVYDGCDIVKYAETVSENVKAAIEGAGTVKRLVLVSSMGAHLREGVVSGREASSNCDEMD